MQSVLHSIIGPTEVHPDNLAGRIAIISGGSQGIGFEVSRALALGGAKVIIVSSDEKHGLDAVTAIKKELSTADVGWKGCDLGKLAEVRELFSKFRDELERLDFLVLCAGVNANQYQENSDGIDRHFGINYLAQWYATNQLWPLIRKTSQKPGVPAPKIVALSSEVHRAVPSDIKFESFEEINNPELGPVQLYGRSKLAMILFVKYGLFEQVIKPGNLSIYANSVHPGTVNTKMQEQWLEAYPGITGQLLSLTVQVAGRDPEQGAYSTLWCLTAPEIEEKKLNGRYFVDPDKLATESSQGQDEQLGLALWKLSAKIVKDKLGADALIDWNAK